MSSTQTMEVYYPSGAKADMAFCEYSLIKSGDFGTVPVLFEDLIEGDGEAVVLDPRGLLLSVLSDANGQKKRVLVYNPRLNDEMSATMQQWMDEHPEWPSIPEGVIVLEKNVLQIVKPSERAKAGVPMPEGISFSPPGNARSTAAARPTTTSRAARRAAEQSRRRNRRW